MINTIIPAPTSILDRPNDPTLYIVWVGYSTERKLWKDMSDREKLLQIQAERRAQYEALFNPNNIC